MSNGLESSLFEWKEWDELDDPGNLQFYECTLKKDIGSFKKGEGIFTIAMIYSESYIELYKYEETEEPVRIKVELKIV